MSGTNPHTRSPLLLRRTLETREVENRQRSPLAASAAPPRISEEATETTIQAQTATGARPSVGPRIAAKIHALSGGGRPLPRGQRAFFEPRIGHDFSQVRIHTDAEAAATARAVQARAFTVGEHVVFGAGEYAPGTDAGRRLLAHELAHVVQQGQREPLIAREPAKSETPRALQARRFAGISFLEEILQDKEVIAEGMSREKFGNDVGEAIDAVQAALTDLGYPISAAEMDKDEWGASSSTAVQRFQVQHGSEAGAALPGIKSDVLARLDNEVALLELRTAEATEVPLDRPAPEKGFKKARAVTFLEHRDHPFDGFDASTAPPWLVVPSGEARVVAMKVKPTRSNPTFRFRGEGRVTLNFNADLTELQVTGETPGTAIIEALQDSKVIGEMTVRVKRIKPVRVAYYFVSDSEGRSTTRSTDQAQQFTQQLNRVWGRQAGLAFETAEAKPAPVATPLGDPIFLERTDLPEGDPAARKAQIAFEQIKATGGGGDFNVYLVWRFVRSQEQADQRANQPKGSINASDHNVDFDAALQNIKTTTTWDSLAFNKGDSAVVPDDWAGCRLVIAHEAGHFLGVGHRGGGLMAPTCGGNDEQRVSKEQADLANP